MIVFTEFGYWVHCLFSAGSGLLIGWCLAWRHYDKHGSVGVPFIKRTWPRKPDIPSVFD